jgi:hypothetical protein
MVLWPHDRTEAPFNHREPQKVKVNGAPGARIRRNLLKHLVSIFSFLSPDFHFLVLGFDFLGPGFQFLALGFQFLASPDSPAAATKVVTFWRLTL